MTIYFIYINAVSKNILCYIFIQLNCINIIEYSITKPLLSSVQSKVIHIKSHRKKYPCKHANVSMLNTLIRIVAKSKLQFIIYLVQDNYTSKNIFCTNYQVMNYKNKKSNE